MKKIISSLPLLVLFFVISCRKEKIENYVTTNQSKLHPCGALPEDPSLIEKVGYYAIDKNIGLQSSFPSKVDLSVKMPAVGDQGDQGSCGGWAFGYYYKTYQEVIEKAWIVNNNAYSPSWVYNQINGGVDNGSSGSDACELLVNNGCDFNDNFPYDATNYTSQPNSASKTNALHYKSQSWKFLDKTTNTFRTVLASSQVLVIRIPIYPDFDNLNSGNPIYDDWGGELRGYHFVCVVGYDDSKQAFKFVNSWGTGWGLSGYGWIAYSKIPDLTYAYLITDKSNVYDTKYLLGDFNGDGAKDIFTANGYGFYNSWKGTSGLKNINLSSYTINSSFLKEGDFNGDGKADIFYANTTDWYVSYSGTGSFTRINTLNTNITELGFGDFNGDGKTDVFYPVLNSWYVSYSGTGSWTRINYFSTEDYMLSQLHLGDFNGDGKTDVFKTTGSYWYVSYSGTGSWTNINTSSTTLGSLGFGDFNGDGKTDAFKATGIDWYVSYSGTGSWAKINTSSTTLDKLGFGDLNGDHKCDVFYPTTASWKVSWAGTSGWNNL